MSKNILEVEHVSKQYRLGEVGTGTMSDDIKRWWYRARGKEDPFLTVGIENDRSQGGGDYVWALRDISLTLKEGDVLGIIGRNGAGKSTLLKLLSRVTSPTTGEIRYNGRLACLLEVGTGFHPDLTGRENVYLNGAILGMTRKEVAAKMDEIVDFSGCAKYLDTPVKRYSSGMKVRLGFAVAAHLEPEILVVDEVLAVGDAEFQKKCIGKMQDVAGRGRTVLFVSHNMSSIRNLCERVLVLNNGKVTYDGDVSQGINHYLSLNESDMSQGSHLVFEEKEGIGQIKEISVLNKNVEALGIEFTDKIEIRCKFSFKEKVPGIFLGIALEDSNANTILMSSSDEIESRVIRGSGEEIIKIVIPERILKPGKYVMTFSLRDGYNILHKVERELTFTIVDNKTIRGMKNRYRPAAIVAPEIQYHKL